MTPPPADPPIDPPAPAASPAAGAPAAQAPAPPSAARMTPPAATAQAPAIEVSPQLQRRAFGLMLLFALLLVATVVYLLYARGTFEPKQRLVLVADDSEGVAVGLDMTFSGFAIGRVSRITLGEDGTARIEVEVPRKDARWLRQSSVFTLTRGLVGGTAIKAYSGVLTDPPLPDGAERRVLAGDAASDIPKVVGAVKDLLANLNALTAPDAALAGTLANVQTTTGRLNGPQGALGVVMGDAANLARVQATLERTNALLARLDGLARRTDGLVGQVSGTLERADRQLLGPGGVVADGQAGLKQLQALLAQAQGTLKGVDAVLVEAQGIARNTRAATADLDALRAEVEASLRRIQHLVNEVNRRWPFKAETEVKLP